MKDIRIDEARTSDAESGIAANLMEAKLDFVLPKSCLDEIAASQCSSPQTVKSDSKSGEQDPLDPVSLMIPLVKESNSINLSSGGRELCPVTPSPNGETAKLSLASDQTHDLNVLSDCETPSQNTFNPFAPAPEELPLAPKKKMPREFKMPTRRKLKFDTCCDFDETVESTILDEDDYILESICKSILELVVSNQANEISDGLVEGDNSHVVSYGVKTPTSMPALTGIAETCPDAPLRQRTKSRMPDQSICRKLEFESCLI